MQTYASIRRNDGSDCLPTRLAQRLRLVVALAAPASADPIKLRIACTATSDCASAMVARDAGIFAKHGIDADVTLIAINTTIPPAIVSNSIQIGGPTATVFLQAVDADSISSQWMAPR